MVSVSPDKKNINTAHVTVEKMFEPIADQIYEDQNTVGHTMIVVSYTDFFTERLGCRFTYPHGSPDLCCNRVVDMFHSCTEPCIKYAIIKHFSTPSPLRVVPLPLAWVWISMTFETSYILDHVRTLRCMYRQSVELDEMATIQWPFFYPEKGPNNISVHQ